MKHILSIILIVSQLSCLAESIRVESMDLIDADGSSEKILDLNGDACASISVETDIDGLQFVGNIVDCKPSNHGYRIYLIGGTRKITVFHSTILPTDIIFNDYGIKYVKPSEHYSLSCTILNESKGEINLFDDSPEMVYARYEYASQLTDGALYKFVDLDNDIHVFDFNRPDYGTRELTEDEKLSVAKKYIPQFAQEVRDAITATRLGYAPALDVLRKAYNSTYTLPFLEPYLEELKKDSENKLSRMMVNFITNVSTYNPQTKLMEQSISTACGITLQEEDSIDVSLHFNEKTMTLIEDILEYNRIAKKLGNYRIECTIREPSLILHAKFINKPYRVLSANDYNASSRIDAKESFLRIKLLILWQKIKENCIQNV